ncbi:MAG: glycosyltransferase family 2 protein [Lachnospiraceae bacterium]|nr:glycosyltransferase family 2 protein [Lachnospiraceae bacterium]
MIPVLYVVIPCYNEEEVLRENNKRLNIKIENMIKAGIISEKSRIMYVDDGSRDKTWNIICELYENNKYSLGLRLSKNRGHQNALLAGLFESAKYSDIVISMDADLQDDIEVMDEFVKEYNLGSDIVYGVRNSRKKDTAFKRGTALMFYRLMKTLGVDMVYNHADYRLMSKRAIETLESYKEVNLFLRGIVPLIGFKTSQVEYERGERFAGESKYPLNKMIQFAIEGITSFSVRPIRIITVSGIIISLVSLIMIIYSVIGHFLGYTITGWTTLVVALYFLGGFQIFSIGIVGEYIGKIYLEVKQRPRYTIAERKTDKGDI